MDAVQLARRLLQDVTPLKRDCGLFCGAACCQGDEETGMLLFPGEGGLYTNCAFGHVLPMSALPGDGLFVCQGRCPRDMRPLSCRLFPLFLFFNGDETEIRMDPRCHDLCPLYSSGLQGLSPDFVRTVREAYDLLLEDTNCRRFLLALSSSLQL